MSEVLCCSDLLCMCAYMSISAFVCMGLCVAVCASVCACWFQCVCVPLRQCVCPLTPVSSGKHIVLRTIIMRRSCGPDMINTIIGCVEGGDKNQKNRTNTRKN